MFGLSRIQQIFRKAKLSKVGANCYVGKSCNLQGNIEVGNNVKIGRNANFVSTRAAIHIHDYVIFGPSVTIYTGDHPIDIVGRHIGEITDKDKSNRTGDDIDVTIEAGCWIGTNAIILKGVTIGRGSVIAAGAIVTKNVPPYSIYMGIPAQRTVPRFTEEQIVLHESMLKQRSITIE